MCKTTVIIPNYNGLHFLEDCLASLRESTVPYKLIVVDNGSTDGSIDWLVNNGIEHIALESNTGFSHAVNCGIKAAETEFVLLLNNDTVAEPDFIEELEKALTANEDAFAVSAQMIKASDHSLIDSAGDGMSIVGWAYQRGIDEPAENYQKPCEVFSACAGAAIYRRSIMEKIGYFDEMHFAYLEDIDVSWRAQLAGYRVYYEPKAKVYHLGSATSGSKYNDFKVRLTSRNNILLHYKNLSPLQKVVNFIPLECGIIGKAVFFARRGYTKPYWEGIREGRKIRRQCVKAPYAGAAHLRIEGILIKGFFEYLKSYLGRH